MVLPRLAQTSTVLWTAAALAQCMCGCAKEHTGVTVPFSTAAAADPSLCGWEAPVSPYFAQILDGTTAATKGAGHSAQSWTPWLPAGLYPHLSWRAFWLKQRHVSEYVRPELLSAD